MDPNEIFKFYQKLMDGIFLLFNEVTVASRCKIDLNYFPGKSFVLKLWTQNKVLQVLQKN